MKVLVVGSGGAEHVLARALRASPGVREVFVAPGNVGMTDMAATVNLEVGEAESIAEWATEAGIDLVVLGERQPLWPGSPTPAWPQISRR